MTPRRAPLMRPNSRPLQSRDRQLDEGEVDLDEHSIGSVTVALADERVAELRAESAAPSDGWRSLHARHRGAVRQPRPQGRRGVAAENHGGSGLLGSIANLVKVRPGYEVAVAAVLGAAADAVAAENSGAARSAVAALEGVRRWPCCHRPGRLADPRRTEHRPAARGGAVGTGSG